ncbi:hypothetical protein EMIT0357P_10675 [Pseudomonas marginalis]
MIDGGVIALQMRQDISDAVSEHITHEL